MTTDQLTHILDGNDVVIPYARMGHTGDCPTCAPIWAKYTALAQQAAKEGPHTMITAGYVVQLTNTTDAMVLVDAQDMADTDPS